MAIKSTVKGDDDQMVTLAATLITMAHPDNGACDLYKTNKAGNLLVPASEAATMFDHGFVVVNNTAAD